MSTIVKGTNTWNRLHAMWLAQRKPGMLVLGTDTYVVNTPNGDEEPVFTGYEEQSLYGQTSTQAMVDGSTQKRKGK